jgi:choline dehydrogenase-like flavoprotein
MRIVGIRLADNKSTVNHIEVRTYAGKGFRVISRCLVLAAGGIENPRLLLNANKDIDKGIGNDHDNVGRYFAEHPHHTVGEFILEDAVREGLPRRWKRWFHAYEFFSATERLMREDEILNFGLRFKHYRREPRDFEERLKRIVCRSELAEGATEWLLDEDIPCFGHGHIEGALKIASEQAPNAMSRVRLDSQTDQFGNRRIALDWRLSEIDKRTIRIATFKFGEALAKLNLGRLRVADWLMTPDSDLDLPGLGKAELGGNHHLCTTRMASSPRYGVVDENQRVFGTDNLYVAGSSVFSTGGHANPTLTIVQLALRLADHLNCILTRLQPTVACELGSVEQIESTSPRPGVC